MQTHNPELLICAIISINVINITRPKNILKMNKEVRMLLPKKDLIQVE